MSKEHIEKHQWTKGQSGNPSGKKKGTKNRSTIIREMLDMMVQVKDDNGDEVWQSNEYRMVQAILTKAIEKGDVAAFNSIMDNVYGKLKDTVDMNTTEQVNHDFRKLIAGIKATQ
jgi:metal-responsive CopG/Arc/MetJ family transcriptional regulator